MSWLQERLKQAEELLHAVDRTAKAVSTEIGKRPGERPPSQRAERRNGVPPASLNHPVWTLHLYCRRGR